MGYSYGYNERGNLVLSCDNCGNLGGVRKRTCPYKVLGDSLRGGRRHEMHYCYPPALCAVCYVKLGGLHGVHGQDCRDGAAAMQARYDATEARIQAGESFVTSAYGDWHDAVPAGWTGVTFDGRGGESYRLVPKDSYDPGRKPALSDYPDAMPWDGPNGQAAERAA